MPLVLVVAWRARVVLVLYRIRGDEVNNMILDYENKTERSALQELTNDNHCRASLSP